MAFTKTPMTEEERKAKKRDSSLRSYYKRHEHHKARMRNRDPELRRADARARRAAEPEKYRGYGREEQLRRRIKQPWLASFHACRKRAIKKGLRFSLTTDWCKETYTGFCAITGIAFETVKTAGGSPGPKPRSISIDKIDPLLGYTPDNCRFILHGVNAFRGSGTDDEMRTVLKAIAAR